MSSARKKPSTSSAINGKVVSTVPGFVLVKKAASKRVRDTEVTERAGFLLPQVAKALSRPGISKETVFKGRTHNVYSYSVDTTDTSRVVRTSADGHRTVGRLVGAKFVPVKVA